MAGEQSGSIVKVLARSSAKADSLRSLEPTRWEERTDFYKLSSDPIDLQTNKQKIKNKKRGLNSDLF